VKEQKEVPGPRNCSWENCKWEELAWKQMRSRGHGGDHSPADTPSQRPERPECQNSVSATLDD